MRPIDDILKFRGDIPPFLVHLTRNLDNVTAKERLRSILNQGQLHASERQISDARFGTFTNNMSAADLKRFFGAVCFTETPLSEVHCLLEIQYRNVNLEPYGLVFLKQKLIQRSVG